ncbi:MAG: hypothetical protein GX804_06255 [Lentisphaerae bacterium]|jgi:fumarate hydratase class I|nr:hypothetical protein [Lentisphaerota bacterium]
MSSKSISLHYPFYEKDVRTLSAGDIIDISGLVYTGRDRLHKHLAETGVSPVDLQNGAVFHCGPVVLRNGDGSWRIVAAGPTTSIREEPYMASIVETQGVRIVIGKGGLGKKSLEAFARFGCVYVQAVGGAAAVIANSVKKVENVFFLEEFGATEAMWVLEVEKLPGIVAMDSHGRSLYNEIAETSKEALARQGARQAVPVVSG